MSRSRLLWLLGWAAATAIGVVAFSRVRWGEVASVLAGGAPGWLAVAALLNLSILGLWATQWRLFLPRGAVLSLRSMFEVVAVVSTVANGGPPLTGHATGAHLLAGRVGTAGSRYAQGVAVVALDQLAEGLAKVLLLVAVLAFTPLPPALEGALTTLLVAVGVLGAGLLWAAHRVTAPSPADPAEGPVLAATGAGRVTAFLRNVAASLDALRDPRMAVGGLALALAMKAAELGGIWAVQRGFGVDLGLGGSLLVLASVSLATMVSVAPANLGVYEASAFAAYRLAGVDPEMATALALAQHAVYLLPATGTGWLLLTLTGPARTAEGGD
ncbi:MAG TPA: lysylphosphatidylglycerol synthase transmembrane domain-containing protein [Longimicrobiales bacterium]